MFGREIIGEALCGDAGPWKGSPAPRLTAGRHYRVLRTVVIDDTRWVEVLNDKGLAETVDLGRFSELKGVPR